jgi:hypothetical protein
VPGTSDVEVEQPVDGSAATQRVDPPEVNVTVPVAPPGSPDTDSVSLVPYGTLAGAADSVIAVLESVTVKAAPVAVVPLKLALPEYVAVTG